MNEIVGHSWMVRMPGKLRFENRSRLQCPGISLVGWRLTCREIKRVEYQCFIVILITRRKPFIGVGQRSDAIALQPLRETVVVGSDGLDEITLTLRLGANGAAAIDLRLCASRIFGSGADAERIAYEEGSNPPSGNRTVFITVERFPERFLAQRIGKGMQVGDAALKALLGLRRAGIGEGDGTEFDRRHAILMSPGARHGQQAQEHGNDRRDPHGGKPFPNFLRRNSRNLSSPLIRGHGFLLMSDNNAAAICSLPAVAAKGLDEPAAWIDQIEVGAVIVSVIAVIGIVALIENIEAFCGCGNLRRTSGKADKTRIEGFQVLGKQIRLVALRIDRDEYGLHRCGPRPERLEGLGKLHHGRRANVGAKRIAEIDHKPFAPIALLGDQLCRRTR